jgi:hypothetical protein
MKCPYFEVFNSEKEIKTVIEKQLKDINQQSLNSFYKNRTAMELLPEGAYVISYGNHSCNYTIVYNDNTVYQRSRIYHRQFMIPFVKSRMISLMDSSLFFEKTNNRIISMIKAFPFKIEEQTLNFNDILGMAIFPFALSFLLPIFLYTLVMEKEKKLREMMKLV